MRAKVTNGGTVFPRLDAWASISRLCRRLKRVGRPIMERWYTFIRNLMLSSDSVSSVANCDIYDDGHELPKCFVMKLNPIRSFMTSCGSVVSHLTEAS